MIDRCFREDRYRDPDVLAKIDIAIAKIHHDRDESPNPPQKANWGNSDQSLFNPDLSKGGDTNKSIKYSRIKTIEIWVSKIGLHVHCVASNGL